MSKTTILSAQASTNVQPKQPTSLTLPSFRRSAVINTQAAWHMFSIYCMLYMLFGRLKRIHVHYT